MQPPHGATQAMQLDHMSCPTGTLSNTPHHSKTNMCSCVWFLHPLLLPLDKCLALSWLNPDIFLFALYGIWCQFSPDVSIDSFKVLLQHSAPLYMRKQLNKTFGCIVILVWHNASISTHASCWRKRAGGENGGGVEEEVKRWEGRKKGREERWRWRNTFHLVV